MRIEPSRRFQNELRRVRDTESLGGVYDAIAKIEAAATVEEIPGVERVQHPRIPYYRVRVGKYRIVFEPVGGAAVLVRFRHRKDAYKNLPGCAREGSANPVAGSVSI